MSDETPAYYDLTRPETVYELCDMVCDAIAMKPLNYFQGSWKCNTNELSQSSEACGTAYCRAGWMTAMLNPPGKQLMDIEIVNTASGILRQAGIPSWAIDGLFDGAALKNDTIAKYGTLAYANAGIAGMRRFMADNEAKLKAARINPDNTVTVVKNDG